MSISHRHRPFSLAVRLTFFISLATIFAFAVLTSIMLNSVKTHFADMDEQDLNKIKMTLSSILLEPGASEAEKVEKVSVILASYRHISVLMLNADDQMLYQSPDGPDLMPVLNTPQFTESLKTGSVFQWSDRVAAPDAHDNHGPKTYRILAASVSAPYHGKDSTCTFVISFSIDFHLHYLDELKYNLWLIAAVMGLLIVLIVVFAVHKGHAPLRTVSLKIKNISSENLDVRLNPKTVPVELEQLVISFNHMIERIEDVFTRQSNFSADIAHEIRTPVTNLVTQTEIALSQPRSTKELEDVLYSSLEEYNRMAKMVSDMLFLAQADNHQLILEHTRLDLRAETLKVFDFFEAWAEEQHVTLKISGLSCWVEGDALMLRRVMNNLLSNAIRYTPQGEAVQVTLSTDDEWVKVVIANPGRVIPAEHLSRIFDRFYQIDPSRQRKTAGSGIGLAIVKSIVGAHQGKISAASDSVSTRFTLLLPRLKS
ncbi:Cu(+)/Ag(+) sensor histidine kinase [Klebsiella sp. BIGb0407]|uniref:Cu(+)/Ag(+) sensor histidine kinase n=1 Tax=Klebsiella sp. BIGb0407 TaxID=2940603 RepID=UPI002169EE4D|nr:Cu(+)/Ag(+) sensor histidine kinase [Klebsiella sp. BIGb0407]MCS3429975.1 two-component system heavy metal sensor histidine kinase CusS [Klebsiella sp. BIGb0407]